MDSQLFKNPHVRSAMLRELARAMQDNPATGTTVMLGTQPAVRLSIDVPLPEDYVGRGPVRDPSIVSSALDQWLWSRVDAGDIATEAAMDDASRLEGAVRRASEGRHEVHLDEDGGSSVLDDACDCQPLCRIEWHEDGGDPSVGMPDVAYWKLVETPEGPESDTGLAKLVHNTRLLNNLLVFLGARQSRLPDDVRQFLRENHPEVQG